MNHKILAIMLMMLFSSVACANSSSVKEVAFVKFDTDIMQKRYPFLQKQYQDAGSVEDKNLISAYVSNIHLNDKDFLLVFTESRYHCASHGCSLQIYLKDKSGYKDIKFSVMTGMPVYTSVCKKHVSLLTRANDKFLKWDFSEGNFKSDKKQYSLLGLEKCARNHDNGGLNDK